MTAPITDRAAEAEPYEAEVRGYVADCLRLRGQLAPAYHPTADGAVKLIPHGSDAEEAERIRQTFAAVTSPAEPEAGQ